MNAEQKISTSIPMHTLAGSVGTKTTRSQDFRDILPQLNPMNLRSKEQRKIIFVFRKENIHFTCRSFFLFLTLPMTRTFRVAEQNR